MDLGVTKGHFHTKFLTNSSDMILSCWTLVNFIFFLWILVCKSWHSPFHFLKGERGPLGIRGQPGVEGPKGVKVRRIMKRVGFGRHRSARTLKQIFLWNRQAQAITQDHVLSNSRWESRFYNYNFCKCFLPGRPRTTRTEGSARGIRFPGCKCEFPAFVLNLFSTTILIQCQIVESYWSYI